MKPNTHTADILPDIENKFIVTDFFFPKPLKTIIKSQDKQSASVENIIKFDTPNPNKKTSLKSSKVKGSWMNLKLKLKARTAEHSQPDSEASLFQQKTYNNSYSRTLQKLSKK